MLRNIEPRHSSVRRGKRKVEYDRVSPKVQIINRALLIPHVNVEGEKIDWSKSASTEDFEEGREAVAQLHLGECVMRHSDGGRLIV